MRPAISHLLLAVLLAGSVTVSCSRTRDGTMMVFAAASLTDVLQAQAEHFLTERELPGDTIRFHFHSSNACALQIRQGAPADLFVSADDGILLGMMHAGMLTRAGYQRLVSNRLVLIAPARHESPIQRSSDLAGSGWRRLAIGNPASTPVGRYARSALESMDLWHAVEGRLLPAEHVRQALLYVRTGEADAGIVYLSDVSNERDVEIVEIISPDHTPAIVFSGGVIRAGRNPEAAREFLRYLASDEAAPIWRRFGFPPIIGQPVELGIPTL